MAFTVSDKLNDPLFRQFTSSLVFYYYYLILVPWYFGLWVTQRSKPSYYEFFNTFSCCRSVFSVWLQYVIFTVLMFERRAALCNISETPLCTLTSLSPQSNGDFWMELTVEGVEGCFYQYGLRFEFLSTKPSSNHYLIIQLICTTMYYSYYKRFYTIMKRWFWGIFFSNVLSS